MTTLFLKYRPQTFADLVGQEAVIRTLQNALKTDRPAHAYLFVGSRGTGKTSTARLLSKGLNCLDLQDGAPCGKCNICMSTADGSLVDVIEIDAASHTGVDNIRDLREKANFMPNIARRKIYIIDEVHMLSKGAFNALLKTLEEPPAHAFFILATTEFDKVPETIVSRCQTFTFGRFTLDQLVDRIEMICEKEKFIAPREALELIARKAEGGLRDAISLLEQLAAETEGQFDADAVRASLGISSGEQLENFYNALENKNPDEAFAVLKDINQCGGDFRAFGHDFLNFLREKMYNSLGNHKQLTQLVEQIEAIETAISRFKTSPLVELPLEIAVIKLCTGYDPTPVSSSMKPLAAPAPSAPTKEAKPTPAPAQPKQEVNAPQPTEGSDFVFDDTPQKPTEPQAVQSKPAPKAESRPMTAPTPGAMTASELKSRLTELSDSAGLAIFAKKSLLTTSPYIDGNKVTFKTNSSFHFAKLTEGSTAAKLQQAIDSLFNTSGTEVKFEAAAATTDNSAQKTATIDDLEF